jgi:hypothetical protein
MQQKNQYTALLLLLNGLYCGTLKRTEITPITGNSTPPRSPLTVAQHLILNIVSIPALNLQDKQCYQSVERVSAAPAEKQRDGA